MENVMKDEQGLHYQEHDLHLNHEYQMIMILNHHDIVLSNVFNSLVTVVDLMLIEYI